MKILKILAMHHNYFHEGVKQDMDYYSIRGRTTMSSHDVTIIVNHVKKTVTGDVVRYGSWDDLDPEEVQELLQAVEKEGKLLKSYSGYTFTCLD